MALIKAHIGIGQWHLPLCGNKQGFETRMNTGEPLLDWFRVYNENPKKCCANCARKIKRIMERNPEALAKM